GVDGVAVILRRDITALRSRCNARLILSPVTEFHFVSIAACRESQNLSGFTDSGSRGRRRYLQNEIRSPGTESAVHCSGNAALLYHVAKSRLRRRHRDRKSVVK